MSRQNNAIAQLTRNMMIVDLMKTTGWSRDRVVAALQQLEANKLVNVTNDGSLRVYGG